MFLFRFHHDPRLLSHWLQVERRRHHLLGCLCGNCAEMVSTTWARHLCSMPEIGFGVSPVVFPSVYPCATFSTFVYVIVSSFSRIILGIVWARYNLYILQCVSPCIKAIDCLIAHIDAPRSRRQVGVPPFVFPMRL